MDTSGFRGLFPSASNNGLFKQSPMNLMNGLNNDHQQFGLMESKGSVGKEYPGNVGKGKAVDHFVAPSNDISSENDEANDSEYGNDEESNGTKGKKGSPWQRMKWTDDVVRLLISVVACVGDDGMHPEIEGLKRKSGILHKKGKWKAVSRIMIKKGCHVSPQQCEDKFNDLNKRYKRLNDTLGRGTSCNVVENPLLLESMSHLSSKAKDGVRKILSSKHLFYKEMYAYHNGLRSPNCQDLDLQGHALVLESCSKENNGSENEEAEGHSDSINDSDSKNDDNNSQDGEMMVKNIKGEDADLWLQSGRHNFEVEIPGIFEDPKLSVQERKKLIKKQMFQLMGQRVNIQAQAFELEKQRIKWLRYCSKKDKEFERLRLENERMRLENEQSLLQGKQKQLEMDIRKSESLSDPDSVQLTDYK